MTIKTLARGLTLFVALAVALTVMAVPAVAAEPNAIASIDGAQRTVIAGASASPFTFTVTNVPVTTAGATSTGTNINNIRITPPGGYFTALPFTTAGQLPDGWTGFVHPSTGQYVLRTQSANAVIVPGGQLSFTVAAAVYRAPVDALNKRWFVQVSGNDGQTYTHASPDPQPTVTNPTGTGEAALQTTIRVLQVVTTKLAFPAGVTDGSVTSGQTADVQLDVTNHGSGTLNVTPNVTFTVPSSSSATGTLIRSATCPDGSATFPARQMGPQSSTTFTCQVRYGGSGAITTNGRASGTPPSGPGSATALGSSQAGVVETAAVFNYVSQSLSPTEVRPGGPVQFTLAVQKSGQVAVALNKANTTISFGPADNPTKFTASLQDPASVPAGGTAAAPHNVFLTFVSTTVPADMPANDGTGKQEYTPTLNIAGNDSNDFAVSSQPSITDRILVDALGPIINLNRPVPPPSRVVDDPNRTDDDPAATNNALVTFSGSIRDREAACGACPIVRSFIRQIGPAGTPVGAEIPVVISNNQGNLSGTYDKVYDPLAIALELVLIGADPGGNQTTATSARIPVDNILPTVTLAVTGTDVQADRNGEIRVNRLIEVSVSEPLAAAMNASDWVVAGHRVVSAEPMPSRGNFTRVRLTVDPELGRNEEPNVTYQPTPGSRANDRVGLLLGDVTIKAVDGIVPRLPEVLTINGLERQENDNGDEQFFTNDDTPAIELEIDPGDTVTVFEDCVATATTTCPEGSVEGELDAGDTARCSVKADPGEESVLCLSSSFGTANRDVTLFARSVDTRDNEGPAASELLTLDFIAPVLAAVQVLAPESHIRVQFSETLSELTGRNDSRTSNWQVIASDGIFETKFTPSRVAGGPGGRERTLNNGEAPGGSLWTREGRVPVRVRYELDVPSGATEAERYMDRAGNVVVDQSIVI